MRKRTIYHASAQVLAQVNPRLLLIAGVQARERRRHPYRPEGPSDQDNSALVLARASGNDASRTHKLREEREDLAPAVHGELERGLERTSLLALLEKCDLVGRVGRRTGVVAPIEQDDANLMRLR